MTIANFPNREKQIIAKDASKHKAELESIHMIVAQLHLGNHNSYFYWFDIEVWPILKN